MIIGPCWDHVGSVLVQTWDQKSIKDRFGDHLGSDMGPKIDFEVDWGTWGDLGGYLEGPWRLLGGAFLKNNGNYPLVLGGVG